MSAERGGVKSHQCLAEPRVKGCLIGRGDVDQPAPLGCESKKAL